MNKTEQILKTSQVILTIIEMDDGINKYLKKADLNFSKNKVEIVTKILNILSVNDDNTSILSEIIETLTEIMEDGKIKLNEIIKLVNVIVKNIKNVKNINITEFSNEDFAVLVKLLIIILYETESIDINTEIELIFNSIDSCVLLIEQMDKINIKINSNNKDNITTVIDKNVSLKCLCFRFEF
jgi:hypothetical protein